MESESDRSLILHACCQVLYFVGLQQRNVPLDHCSRGSSDALIVLSEQADLSEADNLTTKQEKVQYVYAKLREVAERTPAPLRQRLDEMGVPCETFFSLNMTRVNASRDQLYENCSAR